MKEIIFVVLLAAFADLLLPNNKLQKYVKLILSLFVLMTILSPVIGLIKGDWNQQFELALQSVDPSGRKVDAPGKPMEDLDSIIRTGEAMKERQAEAARSMAEAEIAARMKEQIEGRTGLTAAALDITLGVDSKGQWKMDAVKVELSKQPANSPNDEDHQPKAGITPVKPIEPIRPIRIGKDDEAIPVWKGEAPSAKQELEPHPEPILQDLADWLQREWTVPRDRIEVQYIDEQSSGDGS